MSEIYRQDFSSAFTTEGYTSDVFHSATYGGSDSPQPSGYPYLGFAERVIRQAGAGPGGTHLLNARQVDGPPDEWDLVSAGWHELAYGPEADGQYDCRAATWPTGFRKFKIEQQFFDSSAMADIGFLVPFYLFHGGASGDDDSFKTGTGGIFVGCEMDGGGGASANFTWQLFYRRVNGSVAGSSTRIAGSSDVADDAYHKVEIWVKPATITGAFNGVGGLGSASVAADGELRLYVDDVLMASGTGLQNTCNFLATSNPGVYYGRGHKHGDW